MRQSTGTFVSRIFDVNNLGRTLNHTFLLLNNLKRFRICIQNAQKIAHPLALAYLSGLITRDTFQAAVNDIGRLFQGAETAM